MTATLADPVRLALNAGWTVDTPDGPTAVVHCPDGSTVRIPTRRGQEALQRGLRALHRRGLADALDAVEANRERTRTRVSDRAARDRSTSTRAGAAKAVKKAAETTAVRRAASGYFTAPEDIPLTEILQPHPAPRMYRLLVTPDMAKVMLERNTRNRKPRGTDIAQYGGAMAGSEWLLTHQPIAFDTNGALLDGQQRLGAIIESGATADLFVMCGMPAESFEVVDTGRKRNAADTLYVRGETQVVKLAACCRLLHLYDTAEAGRLSTSARVSNHTVARTLEANPLLRAALNSAYPMAKATRGNVTALAVGVFLLWRALGQEHPQVVDFIDAVETGANMARNDPRMRLRQVLIGTADRTQSRNSVRQLAQWLKAWRAYGLRKKVAYIAWRGDERMPGVFIPDPGMADAEWSEEGE